MTDPEDGPDPASGDGPDDVAGRTEATSTSDDGPDHTAGDSKRGDGSTAVDRTGSLSELADALERRRGADGADGGSRSDAGPDFDELFDREAVAEVDRDRLWERLESDDPPETAVPDDGDDREIREIDKGSYCHGCEHFAEPPAVECTRDGTAILELTALETFRVADCPVVLEDERLEKRY